MGPQPPFPSGDAGAYPPSGPSGHNPPVGSHPNTAPPFSQPGGYPSPAGSGYPAASYNQSQPQGYPLGAQPAPVVCPSGISGHPPSGVYPPASGASAGLPLYPSVAGYPPTGGAAPSAPTSYPAGCTQPPVGAYGGIDVKLGNLSLNPGQQPIRSAVPAQPVYQGTVKPVSPFDPKADCELLRKAMKGIGTDEATIINILAHRSNEQRQTLKRDYVTLFGKDLLKQLKSELGGNFREVILALMMSHDHFDAHTLRKAMKGAGTDEAMLIDIICTRSNKEVKDIRVAYKEMHKRDLLADIESETSGYFRRVLISMCQGNRDESVVVDSSKVAADVQQLYQAGQARWGTDEVSFNSVLVSRSIPHLQQVFNEYKRVHGKDIVDVIRSEMSGDLKNSLLCIVEAARCSPEYFARRLKESMQGAGTNDDLLISLVVSRSERDMVQIKQAFQSKYGKSLDSWIKDDCSGDYRKVLLALIGT